MQNIFLLINKNNFHQYVKAWMSCFRRVPEKINFVCVTSSHFYLKIFCCWHVEGGSGMKLQVNTVKQKFKLFNTMNFLHRIWFVGRDGKFMIHRGGDGKSECNESLLTRRHTQLNYYSRDTKIDINFPALDSRCILPFFHPPSPARTHIIVVISHIYLCTCWSIFIAK